MRQEFERYGQSDNQFRSFFRDFIYFFQFWTQSHAKRLRYDMDPKSTVYKLNVILRLRIAKLLSNIFVDERLKIMKRLIKTSRLIVHCSIFSVHLCSAPNQLHCTGTKRQQHEMVNLAKLIRLLAQWENINWKTYFQVYEAMVLTYTFDICTALKVKYERFPRWEERTNTHFNLLIIFFPFLICHENIKALDILFKPTVDKKKRKTSEGTNELLFAEYVCSEWNFYEKHPKYRITKNRKRYFVFGIDWNHMNRVDWKKLCKGLQTCWKVTYKYKWRWQQRANLQRLSTMILLQLIKMKNFFSFPFCFSISLTQWLNIFFIFCSNDLPGNQLHFLCKMKQINEQRKIANCSGGVQMNLSKAHET